MSDLIDRDSVMHDLMQLGGYATSYAGYAALQKIASAPAVDAVEVVRCKNCMYRDNVDECPMIYYENIWEESEGHIDGDIANLTEDDGFCHRGVKKDAD